MKKYLIGIAVVILIILGLLVIMFPSQVRSSLSVIGDWSDQVAAVFMSHNTKTVDEIQSRYTATSTGKVRVLLVPGHEPGFGGTIFGSAVERQMNVELAQDLQSLLATDPHYQVFVTRDDTAWSPEFAEYFKNNWDDILTWEKSAQKEFSNLVALGETTRTTSTVYHNDAPTDVALRLYGITKWANENDIDITIHIHFNDYNRANTRAAGKYSGFAIYVPAAQYANSSTTKVIADSIFDRLSEYSHVSTLPEESGGVIDEPELIAIGANNTADAASLLIEYGYIYRPQFQTAATRHDTIQNFAQQTFLGLQDFFEPQ